MNLSTSANHPHNQVRKLSLPLFAGATLLAAMCTPALAASLCVAPGGTGGCYATISAAVAAASPGSTIKVWPGTYKEDVVIGKSLSLLGSGSANTIINAAGLNNAIYVDGLDNPGLSNVIVSGFTLENAKFEGILLTNASDVIVKSNYVAHNNNNLDVEMGTCPGIPDFETSEGEDCGEGIHIMGVSYSTIANNVSFDNSGGILTATTPAKPTTTSSPATTSMTTAMHAESPVHRTALTSKRPTPPTTASFTTRLPTTHPSIMEPLFQEPEQASASSPTAAVQASSPGTSSSGTRCRTTASPV